MYEFYARDTSRKIKSVFKAKGINGKHVTGTVIYGYLWDKKREHWIVDEEAATVVCRIFTMTLEGYGPYQISSQLSQEKVEIPSVHLARYGECVNGYQGHIRLGFAHHRKHPQKAGIPRPYR